MTGCNSFETTLTELKIARAYGKLSSIPANGPEASVLLASIGSCEIRMFRGPEAALDGTPLFWLELIDHSIKRPSTAAVATGSKTLSLYSTISSRRQLV